MLDWELFADLVGKNLWFGLKSLQAVLEFECEGSNPFLKEFLLLPVGALYEHDLHQGSHLYLSDSVEFRQKLWHIRQVVEKRNEFKSIIDGFWFFSFVSISKGFFELE